MRTDRLRQLADFLDTLKPDQFDFDRVRSPCGTVCCAIGWTPTVFPELVTTDLQSKSLRCTETLCKEGLHDNKVGFRDIAIALFGMTYSHACDLFQPDHASPVDGVTLPSDALPSEVADRLRVYADWADCTNSTGKTKQR